MTTPEQLQAWREEFEVGLHRLSKIRSKCGLYVDHTVHEQWQGYLRRCQETEQITKLAKFGAMVAKSHADGDFIEPEALTSALIASGSAVEHIKGKIDYAPNIEATIKELLK